MKAWVKEMLGGFSFFSSLLVLMLVGEKRGQLISSQGLHGTTLVGGRGTETVLWVCVCLRGWLVGYADLALLLCETLAT